ncbi:hypothetical protein LCGC14_0207750 [marine sediment metagenome]|uniref:Uncharacterized protein n=1 Tax=marine sediment metagenome TaxID=412755 RepID=A0A0F9UKY5_9ZZZZ
MALFTLGNWNIINNEEEHLFEYYANHKCDLKVYSKVRKLSKNTTVRPGSYAWFTSDDPCVCYYCEEPVPDEIQGLMVLLMAGAKGVSDG